MAITFDAVSNNYNPSATTTDTVSITVGSSGNRLLLVSAVGSTVAVTGITSNGSAMTLLGVASGINPIYVYGMLAPASGANSIVVTFTGGTTDIQVFATSYAGVSQTGLPDASSFTQTASGNLTLSLTTIANNTWLWSCARNGSSGPMGASTGTTDRSTGTRFMSGGDSNGALTPAGSHSMAWTASSGTSYGPILSFAPAVATPINSGFFFATR